MRLFFVLRDDFHHITPIDAVVFRHIQNHRFEFAENHFVMIDITVNRRFADTEVFRHAVRSLTAISVWLLERNLKFVADDVSIRSIA